MTNDTIREIFARVLAGEICRPGTFSLRTLETIRLMDQSVARTLDRLRQFLFNSKFVFDEGNMEKALLTRGFSFEDQLELHDAGLTDDRLTITITITIRPGDFCIWKYGNLHLRARVLKESREQAISIIRLTRMGREIVSVLSIKEDEGYYMSVGKMLAAEIKGKTLVDWQRTDEKEWRVFVE